MDITTINKIDPTLSNHLGWDTESVQNEEMVTLVKRKVVYSEIAMPKSEAIKMLSLIEDDESGIHEYFEENIEDKMVTDDVMEDYGKHEDRYALFEGDITSMTDDVMGMCKFKWTTSYMDNDMKIQPVEFSLL